MNFPKLFFVGCLISLSDGSGNRGERVAMTDDPMADLAAVRCLKKCKADKASRVLHGSKAAKVLGEDIDCDKLCNPDRK